MEETAMLKWSQTMGKADARQGGFALRPMGT